VPTAAGDGTRMDGTGYADGTRTMKSVPETDVVWVAYFAPYSMERHHDLVSTVAALPGVEYLSLGKSTDGQDLDCLTIGEGELTCWLYARQHPGESQAEWWMEGALEKPTDPDDPVPPVLPREVTFHILPEIKPGGVPSRPPPACPGRGETPHAAPTPAGAGCRIRCGTN